MPKEDVIYIIAVEIILEDYLLKTLFIITIVMHLFIIVYWHFVIFISPQK